MCTQSSPAEKAINRRKEMNMKVFEATVIGMRSFVSKKDNNRYRIAYVKFERDGVNGEATSECFVNEDVAVGDVLEGVMFNGKFAPLDEKE